MFRCTAALAACITSFAAHASCGSAFCMVNTGWSAQGAWTEPGTRFDLRYEYINQDQPMAGTKKVSVGQIPQHHDEVFTKNQNLLASLDHTFGGGNWGVNVLLPVVDRQHEHIHNHMGAQLVETWDFTALGDVRVLGRYQFNPRQSGDRHDVWGLNFGLKLPTGKFDEANAEGDVAERSLQPGSGTTDALLGAYFSSQLPLKNFSWFVQGLFQAALNERQQFKPGNKFGLDLGTRYEAGERVALMLQFNYLYKARDSGAEAEPEDSGGNFVFVSPGASWNLTKDLQLYGFVQVPIYQKVNGVQLTADYGLVLGLSSRF